MIIAQRLVRMQTLQRCLQLGEGRTFTVSGEEEGRVIDVAAPATEQGALIMAEGDPVGVFGKRLQRGRIVPGSCLYSEAGQRQQHGKQRSEHGKPQVKAEVPEALGAATARQSSPDRAAA